VFGVFRDKDQAVRAVQALEGHHFSPQEVSLLAKDEAKRGGQGDTVADGTAWGAGVGATAGLLASAGLLAIPGIGPILAAGPIAAALAGAGAGGLAGGLMDYGIPAQTGHRLEADIRRGEAVVLVRCDEGRAREAEAQLRELGAHDVEMHGLEPPNRGPLSGMLQMGQDR
jgi:uncharacterized membrane protein